MCCRSGIQSSAMEEINRGEHPQHRGMRSSALAGKTASWRLPDASFGWLGRSKFTWGEVVKPSNPPPPPSSFLTHFFSFFSFSFEPLSEFLVLYLWGNPLGNKNINLSSLVKRRKREREREEEMRGIAATRKPSSFISVETGGGREKKLHFQRPDDLHFIISKTSSRLANLSALVAI